MKTETNRSVVHAGADNRQEQISCYQLVRGEFRCSNFWLTPSNPRLLFSDQWGYSALYLYWRLLWAAYHVGWIVYDWIDNAMYNPRPATWLIYLTNWTFFCLSVSAVLRAAVVLVSRGKTQLAGDDATTWYMKAVWLIYEIVSPASILVTILFFLFLFKGTLTPSSAAMHLFNTVYVVTDLYVTAMPVRLLHLVYFQTYALAYLVFSVIYWAAGGVNRGGESYIYKLLDWSAPKATAPLVVEILLLGVPLVHLVLWSLYMSRLLLHRHCCHRVAAAAAPVRGDPELALEEGQSVSAVPSESASYATTEMKSTI